MTTASSGVAARPRRSSAKAPPSCGYAVSGSQVEPGEPASVPEPITITSAQARSRAITNRSASLAAAISRFECASAGMATTPSIVETKFATTRGRSKPSVPP